MKLSVFIFCLLALLTTHYALPTPTHAHSSVQVIKMTPNAYEPSEVTVDENSTIIFINQDTVSRWPASNLHPTHELYPEFDPKHEITPGESWSFKPKRPGVWKYHDHTNPHIRGTLTISREESSPASLASLRERSGPNFLIYPTSLFSSVKNFLASLYDKMRGLLTPPQLPKIEEFKELTSNEQFQVLSDLAKSQGADKAWSFIQETFKQEAGSSGNIHDLAHLTGKLLYEDKGISGLSNCTPTFAFGCYHGLLDAAFKTSLNDLPQAEKECEKLGAVGSGPYGSCIHGIGHGIASFHQSRDIEKALLSCDLLRQGRDFCFDGVFMEFARSAQNAFYTKGKPFYPCDALEEDFGDIYSTSCGRNQPVVFVSRLGMTFENAIKLCGENSLSEKFKGSCFDALGFMLASTQDVSKIINGCKSIANTHYSSLCFKSSAGELIFQNVPGWQEKSKEVCDASPASRRKLCHDNRTRLIQEYGRDEENYIRSQMKICLDSGGSDNCYKKVANLFSERFGLKKTLTVFAQNEQYPEIYSRCHEATHYLSRNEYKSTKSVAAVYAQCNSTCHGGCYHGVLEQYLKEKNLQSNKLAAEFPQVCGKPEDYASPLIYNECMHGLGHAAMFVTDTEVPDSLALCDTLSAQEHKERCYSGVFMENSSSSTNNEHPGKYIKADDPFYPCNWLEEKYSRLCWRYQSSYFALITNHDWVKTAKFCQQVPEVYQDDCFRTIGTNQVGFTQDTAQMRNNCSLMPTPHFQEVCVIGVISSFAYRFVGDLERMENFCAKVNKGYQEACFRQVGTSVIDWSKNKNEAGAFCNKLANQEHSSWCQSGIN